MSAVILIRKGWFSCVAICRWCVLLEETDGKSVLSVLPYLPPPGSLSKQSTNCDFFILFIFSHTLNIYIYVEI